MLRRSQHGSAVDGQHEVEHAPPSRLAVQGDLAPHHPRESPADGETQPGAGCRSLRLSEVLEDGFVLLARDARTGVAYGDLELRVAGPFRLHVDFALLRELHRIAEEVDQDLTDALPVKDYLGWSARVVPGKADPLLGGKR